jgi:hypothetical protein
MPSKNQKKQARKKTKRHQKGIRKKVAQFTKTLK